MNDLMTRIGVVVSGSGSDLQKVIDVVACLDIMLNLPAEELAEVVKFLEFRMQQKTGMQESRDLMQQAYASRN